MTYVKVKEDTMITKNMKIEIQSGLEARPVAILVQVASQYDSSIYVEHDNKRVNAKSIMGDRKSVV